MTSKFLLTCFHTEHLRDIAPIENFSCEDLLSDLRERALRDLKEEELHDEATEAYLRTLRDDHFSDDSDAYLLDDSANCSDSCFFIEGLKDSEYFDIDNVVT